MNRNDACLNLMKRLGLPGLAILLAHLTGAAAEQPPAAKIPAAASLMARPLPSTYLHNLFQVTTNVFSGNSPAGEDAFAEVTKLGVKTIISVDGSKPDLATASKYGLRYVHLPFGYDGIPAHRIAELARSAQSVPGPIYVHCHHGLHRGPAAVAVICEANAGWTTNQAVAWLKEAGTSPDYAGLYRSVQEFRPSDDPALAGIVELPQVAQTSSLVEAMVAIDAEFDRLKIAQKSGWSKISDEPNLKPSAVATLLWEHFRELSRAEKTAHHPDDYHAKLASAEKDSDQLRALLRDPKAEAKTRDAGFQALGRSCAACHKKYRD